MVPLKQERISEITTDPCCNIGDMGKPSVWFVEVEELLGAPAPVATVIVSAIDGLMRAPVATTRTVSLAVLVVAKVAEEMVVVSPVAEVARV